MYSDMLPTLLTYLQADFPFLKIEPADGHGNGHITNHHTGIMGLVTRTSSFFGSLGRSLIGGGGRSHPQSQGMRLEMGAGVGVGDATVGGKPGDSVQPNSARHGEPGLDTSWGSGIAGEGAGAQQQYVC